jgi:hypothetical protein
MSMRSTLRAVLLIVALATAAAGTTVQTQTTTPPPPAPSGALAPQQTSPLPGATPQTPGALPAPVPPPANVVSPPLPGRVFAAEQGLIFNAIKPDKAADFETVIAKLRQALATSKDPVRNQQGWGWKIFKATEPGPNGSVLFVFVMDPAVKGADYGVAKILSEAYPAEITDLYRMYSTAFATAGQTLLNLGPVPTPLPTPGAATTPGAAGAAPATTAPGTAPTTTAPTTTTPPASTTSPAATAPR